MQRRHFMRAGAGIATLGGLTAAGTPIALAARPAASNAAPDTPAAERAYLVDLLSRMAVPVLESQAGGTLHRDFVLQVSDTWDGRNARVAYFEAFARALAGAAPWLGLPDDASAEGQLRRRLRLAAQQGLAHGVNPDSADYFMWKGHDQALVEAAYVAAALIRAPGALWEPLDETTKARLVKEFKDIRRIPVRNNNWVLFAAMCEAFLLLAGEEWDPMRIEMAIRKIDEWYAGDGWTGDGDVLHFDYYNSYVMYPFTIEILEVLVARKAVFASTFPPAAYLAKFMKRTQRYCEHLERMVSPAGTYPPLGRSVTYRTAAFQPLALLSLRGALSEKVPPAQARAAMSAVHRAVFTNPTNFNQGGFLTIGFAGQQTSLGDRYSNNGSMYITAASLLTLGLPAVDPYWTAPALDWTQKKAYGGQAFPRDYAVDY